jgi:ATP-dependent Clp protease adapter protein ClpS
MDPLFDPHGCGGCRNTADGQTPVSFYIDKRFPPIRIPEQPPPNESEPKGDLYEVRIIDNDYNTYQEVVEITMAALRITEAEAYAVAWEVDHKGSCVVAQAPREEAEAIAEMIRTIGIEVEVNRISVVES